MKKIFSLLMAVCFLFTASFSLAEAPDGTPPGDPPSGEMGGPGGTPPGNPPSGGMGGPGSSAADISYTAAAEITSASEEADQAYTSETADESALIVNTSDAVTLTNPTVSKTGDSNGGDSCNFYGLNAAVLVMGGSTATITGGTITSGRGQRCFLLWRQRRPKRGRR